MKTTTIVYFFGVCFISNVVYSAIVSDLNPNVDCKTLLASKAEERAKDPTLMNKKADYIQTDPKAATSIYDFTVKDTYMSDVQLGEYCRGFVTIVVSLASSCGLTAANYAQLTQLNKDFEGKIRILAFPCNQFANQMPEGDGDEMLCQFKERNAAPGKILAKVDVNGDNAIPLYSYLKNQLHGEKGADLEWNFVKFLIDKNGKPVKRFPPTFEPKDMVDDINKLL